MIRITNTKRLVGEIVIEDNYRITIEDNDGCYLDTMIISAQLLPLLITELAKLEIK